MNELDRFWSEKLAEAAANARASGRADIAEYLDLRAANDLVRSTGVEWLFAGFAEAALDAARRLPTISVERAEPHSFPYRGANVVGAQLAIRFGVRCLTVEAGWTRTPADGFMRGGALAAARVSHFGIPGAAADLVLARTDAAPVWRRLVAEREADDFHLHHIRRHVELLVAD